jgi:hypothetical protein
MADTERQQQPRTPDTSEHSASKAPETQAAAEERETQPDPRLIPGGAHGAHVDVGMSAMDRDRVPNHADNPGLTNYGDSPTEEEGRRGWPADHGSSITHTNKS